MEFHEPKTWTGESVCPTTDSEAFIEIRAPYGPCGQVAFLRDRVSFRGFCAGKFLLKAYLFRYLDEQTFRYNEPRDAQADAPRMETFIQFHEEAELLRESSGSTKIEETLLKALRIFKLFDIPHYVCRGFAVQEHGYARFTPDVDIIVPDVGFAIEKLSLNGFKKNPGSSMTVTDRETRVEVDLLPGGKKVDPRPLAFPMPVYVSEKPQILTLEELISAKLSTYIGVGVRRAQDYADVVKLIEANGLYGIMAWIQGSGTNIRRFGTNFIDRKTFSA